MPRYALKVPHSCIIDQMVEEVITDRKKFAKKFPERKFSFDKDIENVLKNRMSALEFFPDVFGSAARKDFEKVQFDLES